jgi:hypothetical protein
MKYYAYFVVAMIWFLAGCLRPAFDVKENASSSSQSAEQLATSTTAPDTLVVNSFGMKFVRVKIEPARPPDRWIFVGDSAGSTEDTDPDPFDSLSNCLSFIAPTLSVKMSDSAILHLQAT